MASQQDRLERGAGLEAVLPLGGTAATVMHTLAEDIAPPLKLVMGRRHGPMGGYAHSGDLVMPNWQWVNMITLEAFVLAAQEWVEMGNQVIGGCCGIGPDFVRLFKEQLPAHIPATRTSGQ